MTAAALGDVNKVKFVPTTTQNRFTAFLPDQDAQHDAAHPHNGQDRTHHVHPPGERGEELRYVSHLDMLRFWERALRRARFAVSYSEGFTFGTLTGTERD